MGLPDLCSLSPFLCWRLVALTTLAATSITHLKLQSKCQKSISIVGNTGARLPKKVCVK